MMQFFLLLLSLTLVVTNGYKFLVYNPKIAGSHSLLVGKVADELAYAGHDVVILQPIINPEARTGHSHKDIRLISKDLGYEVPKKSFNVWGGHLGGFFNMREAMLRVGGQLRNSCESQLQDDALMQQLRDEKFDVALTENFDVCGLGIFEMIGLNKTITITGSTMFLQDSSLLGIPTPTSFVPDMFGGEINGFVGRFKNLFRYIMGKFFVGSLFAGEISKAFMLIPGNPDYRELLARSSYLFVNTDELVDYPRPISHKYINIGGYGMKRSLAKVGQLDEKLEKIFENAKKGVIYVSFGSMVKSSDMPEAYRNAFIEAFASFPEVQFVWKYENTSHQVGEGYDNIHTSTWLPQREILVHPKTLAFLTHAGMNSVTEATYSGVPMVCVPVFGEQPRNAEMLVRKGVAVKLDKDTLTTEGIQKALKRVIKDKSFKEKAQKLSTLIKNKPQSPEERIVKTCEFTAQFDIHEHLDLPGRHLNTIQFYNIDVIIVMILIPLVVIVLAFLLFRSVGRKVLGLLGKSKNKKE